MSYQALYRKFRPADFNEVYGQEHVVTALKNQLSSGRIGHAYIFSGTRGTGKTSIAKIFSKSLNCDNPVDGNPCGECASCKKIADGSSINVLEVDGASNNRVENVREIIEDVKYPPVEGKYKVYIIDEAHMVTTAAFNALLKTIEEPPSYAIFILATTEEKKIPITILSRCQRYNFHTITVDTISQRISDIVAAEGVNIDERAIRYIARLGDGSMRDALSILDKTISFYYGKDITYDMTLNMLGASDVEMSSNLFRAISSQNVSEALKIVDSAIVCGIEPVTFVSDFVWYLRNLLLIKNGEEVDDVVDVTTENKELIKEEISLCDNETLMRYINVLSEVLADIKYSALNRVSLEIGIIRLCKPEMDNDYSALINRMELLERKLNEGGFASAPRQEISNKPIQESENHKIVLQKPEKMEKQDKTPVLSQVVSTGFDGRWSQIISTLKEPYRTASKKSIAKVTGDETADIIFCKKSPAAMFYIKDDNVKMLETAIENVTGKHYNINVKFIEEGLFNEELAANSTTETVEEAPETEIKEESRVEDVSMEEESVKTDFFDSLEASGFTIEIEEDE